MGRMGLFRPYRATAVKSTPYPGRCPGLVCRCPFGAGEPGATTKRVATRAWTTMTGNLMAMGVGPKRTARAEFAPQGQPQISPGQSAAPPWVGDASGTPALKGRNKAASRGTYDQDGTDWFVSPLQGYRGESIRYPGRRFAAVAAALCPGLVCWCPFGAEEAGMTMHVPRNGRERHCGDAERSRP